MGLYKKYWGETTMRVQKYKTFKIKVRDYNYTDLVNLIFKKRQKI